MIKDLLHSLPWLLVSAALCTLTLVLTVAACELANGQDPAKTWVQTWVHLLGEEPARRAS